MPRTHIFASQVGFNFSDMFSHTQKWQNGQKKPALWDGFSPTFPWTPRGHVLSIYFSWLQVGWILVVSHHPWGRSTWRPGTGWKWIIFQATNFHGLSWTMLVSGRVSLLLFFLAFMDVYGWKLEYFGGNLKLAVMACDGSMFGRNSQSLTFWWLRKCRFWEASHENLNFQATPHILVDLKHPKPMILRSCLFFFRVLFQVHPPRCHRIGGWNW